MESPKEFIIAKLEELVLIYPKIICKYEFHLPADSYTVEINPAHIFNEVAFKESLADIMFSFYDRFPNESIGFLTEDEGMKIQSPEIIIQGTGYLCAFKAIDQKSLMRAGNHMSKAG